MSALRAQIAVLPNASEPRLRSGRRCCAAANLKKACGPAKGMSGNNYKKLLVLI